MRKALRTWIEGRLAETYGDYWHECELCGECDTTHAPLSTGDVVCWHCAEQAGEFEVPREMEWRVGDPI
jgi:hypothetical protein